MTNRNSIERSGFIISPMASSDFKTLARPFCGVETLDKYFHETCLKHEDKLLVKSYKFIEEQNPDVIIGIAVIRNDSLNLEYIQKKEKDPEGEGVYPAVKIERFGILEKFQQNRYGTIFLSMLKEFFVVDNRTGCRFITLDPSKGAIGFYQKNDFVELDNSRIQSEIELEDDDAICQMIFNLLTDE